jgi:MFS family permease
MTGHDVTEAGVTEAGVTEPGVTLVTSRAGRVIGEVRQSLPRRPAARRLVLSAFFFAVGKGLTMPFLFVYLTEICHLTPAMGGLVIAWMGVFALTVAPTGGALVDRYGARAVALPALVLEAAGVASLVLVAQPWHAFTSAALMGAGSGVASAAINTLLASLTTENERQAAFGLNFMLLNAGLGVGSAISATVIDVSRPASFQVIYLVNAACYLIPFTVVLLAGREVAAPAERGGLSEARRGGPPPASTRPLGYGTVLRDRSLRRLLMFSVVITISGYAQIEVGFTAFAVHVARVGPAIVGYAFAANTLVIVVTQFAVIRWIQGRSRTRLLAAVGGIMAAAWLALGTAGAVTEAVPVGAAILVVGCGIIFAAGETLLSPVGPALLNALATDELRGRYNALGSMVWGISGVAGPASAAGLVGTGHGGLWAVLVVGGCLVASLVALSLHRMVTPAQDGR